MFKEKLQSIPPKHSLSRPHFHHKAVNPLQFQSMTSPYIFIVFMVLYFWKDVLKLSNFIKIFLNILCFLWFDVLKNSPLCSYKSLEVLYFILRTLLWQGIIFIFAKECWFCENKEYPFFSSSDFQFCKSSGGVWPQSFGICPFVWAQGSCFW